MIEGPRYYPEDDFNLDENLDLGQFEYSNQPTTPRFNNSNPRYPPAQPFGQYDHGMQPYVTSEFDDNVLMKPHPEYQNHGTEYGEPSLLPYTQYSQTLPAKHAIRQQSYYDYNDSKSYSRQSTRSRPRSPVYTHHSKPSGYAPSHSHSVRDNAQSRRSSHHLKSFPRSGSSHRSSKTSKNEKIRSFPTPDKKAPHIPLPDYDDDEASVQYIPRPDYN